MFIGMVSFK